MLDFFCYTTSLTFNKTQFEDAISSKAQLEDATSGKAQPESTQLEAEAGGSKKAQLVETQSKEDNIFDM